MNEKNNNDELKTPKHDEMCLWVNKNIRKIFGEIYGEKYEPFQNLTLSWEEPLYNGTYLAGVVDFKYHVEGYSDSSGFSTHGYIEVKPKILSVGEVMRQLKIYKSHKIKCEGNCNSCFPGTWIEPEIILITGTPDFKELFESQGIIYFFVTDQMLCTQGADEWM
jgi:hypothetical protein